MINGRQFKATATLENTLRACCAFEAWAIWADQICINQADVQERNSQVQLMRNIYSLAFGVVVYIGEEGQYTKTGAAFVEELLRRLMGNEQSDSKSIQKVHIPRSAAHVTHLPPPKLQSQSDCNASGSFGTQRSHLGCYPTAPSKKLRLVY
jgi:hypothetical protein